MSVVHFFYANEADDAVVYFVSSELSLLPAENIQNETLAKEWRTDSVFTVGYHNAQLAIYESGTYKEVSLASGTYTGSGLATYIEGRMNSVLSFGYTASYDDSTYKFTFSQTSTNLGFAIVGRSASYPRTVAPLIGFIPPVGSEWTGTASVASVATAKGNQHQLILDMSASVSITGIIIAGHNLSQSSTVIVRGDDSPALLKSSPWLTASAAFYNEMVWGSSTVMVEIDQTSVRSVAFDIYDPQTAYLSIGRIFVGQYFEPENQLSNTISWMSKGIKSRSNGFVSHAGVTYFDKRNSLEGYVWRPPPLDEYYNNTTKTGFDTMADEVGNDTPLFVSFDSTDRVGTTVYVYFNSEFRWTRQGLSPTLYLNELSMMEQR